MPETLSMPGIEPDEQQLNYLPILGVAPETTSFSDSAIALDSEIAVTSEPIGDRLDTGGVANWPTHHTCEGATCIMTCQWNSCGGTCGRTCNCG